ncbi:MAG: 1-deoxy-D-xylulose-5-phosphate synthase, partial [Flavobacteriales bacterium]
GLVGEDGATHAGAFDLTYLRCIPNMVVIAPSDENECRQLLYTGYLHQGPTAVRYPRGTGPGIQTVTVMAPLPIGKGIIRRDGAHIAILNFGSLLSESIAAGDKLNATVVDMRFVKPIDEKLIAQLAESHDLIVTVEENTTAGGAGSGVNEYLAAAEIVFPTLNLGLRDEFLNHGTHQELLAQSGLDSDGIYHSIAKRMNWLEKNNTQTVAK